MENEVPTAVLSPTSTVSLPLVSRVSGSSSASGLPHDPFPSNHTSIDTQRGTEAAHTDISEENLTISDQPSVLPSTPPAPSHSMVTRSKDGTRRPSTKYALDYGLTAQLRSSLSEPTTFKQAASDPRWVEAMNEEYNALLQNKTWTLVPHQTSMNIVGSRWVYKIKEKSDGSIERFKARLVAKGYTQQEGIDFDETFSPVVKATTFRSILSVAVSKNWTIRQLDVKNAFLHGTLSEEVYMAQPPGFVDHLYPNHVCRLNKAIYGLRQAPRAWFLRFSSEIIAAGFSCSKADPSMFILKNSQGTVILLLYVDDIILTGSSDSLIESVINYLASRFAMKDLGALHYFLGIEAKRSSSSLELTQTKYTLSVLSKMKMLDCKPCSTPVSSGRKLSVHEGNILDDPTQYRQLVGALQYLTFTRPDITYAVQQVCQFMHCPRDIHLQAAK